MLYIFMALYAEAAPFIAQMKLKRVNDSGKFVLYQDEAGEAILAVTGPGKVEAAVAVSYVCAKYGTDESTFILNIGSAAGAPNCSDEHVQSAERSELIGQWFIGNQLVDGDTKRTYYPDILYRHPFAEEGIETVSIVRRPDEMKQMIRMDASVNGGQKSGSSLKIRLCDMEAVGVYQAAVRFVGQHQMAFLKVVSDAGVDKRMTAEDLQHFFADSAEKICTWIEDVRTLAVLGKWKRLARKSRKFCNCYVIRHMLP